MAGADSTTPGTTRHGDSLTTRGMIGIGAYATVQVGDLAYRGAGADTIVLGDPTTTIGATTTAHIGVTTTSMAAHSGEAMEVP